MFLRFLQPQSLLITTHILLVAQTHQTTIRRQILLNVMIIQDVTISVTLQRSVTNPCLTFRGKFLHLWSCYVYLTPSSHNLIAFYDDADPSGSNFNNKYGGKNITVTKSCNGKTYTFACIIADTCGNGDCNNCCHRNSDKKTGFLIDMEYYTVLNNFGTTDCVNGDISFVI